MTIMPHNHQMWAVIGVYTGREDNIFWRRIPGSKNGKVEAAGARALCQKDAEPLGPNIIHSVTNPISRLTGAIHVYGGDFFGAERSEWDAETLLEQRYETMTSRLPSQLWSSVALVRCSSVPARSHIPTGNGLSPWRPGMQFRRYITCASTSRPAV